MWTKEQQLAIDKQYGNILVSASAGSGKTAVLVQRIITKVIKYGVDIDKLLVVTFTNAAAAELKERLLKAIYFELDNNPNDMFLKRQLVNINRASITTIHSFCLDIIKSNFFLLDLDPNVSVCDDVKSNILKSNAMETVLESEYQKYNEDLKLGINNTVGLYKILELFNGKDDEFVQTMLKIYSFIQSFEYPFEWLKEQTQKYNINDINTDLYSYDFGKQIYDDCINDFLLLSERIKKYIERLKDEDDFEKHIEMLDSDLESIQRCIQCSYNSWDKLYDNIQSIDFSKNRFPVSKVANQDLKEEVKNFRDKYIKKAVEESKKKIYSLSLNILQELKSMYPYLTYIYDFLTKFDSEYKRLKSEAGCIDFNDIEHLALKLLVNHDKKGSYEITQVAQKLHEKYVEVYTDEYQDTSFIQEAILNAIACGKNRFMVGDIKQSVYKFRQAMPEIFNQKYYTYKSIDEDNKISTEEEMNEKYKIVLSQNFRSRKTVLDSINYIFSRLMNKDLGECEYSDIEKLKYGSDKYSTDENEKNNDYLTELNILEVKDFNEYQNDESLDDEKKQAKEYIQDLKKFEIESIYIAQKINDIVKNKSFRVYDTKNNCLKDASYKDIVILLRNIKDKGNILEKTLKSFNIPVFSDSITSLFDSDEVKCVMSFLQVIDNPLQDIPLVSIMFSIIGKFSLDELNEIRMYLPNGYFYESLLLASKDDKSKIYNKVNDFLNILKKFKQYSKVYNITELLIKMYKETGIYIQTLLIENTVQAKANLDSLLQVSQKYDENGSSSLYSFIQYIDKLKDKKSSETTAKIIGENEDVVRIMTIHKSKGLEFPIVILADTASTYNMQDLRSNIVMHHDFGIGINCIDDEYKVTYPSVIKQAVKNVMKKEIKSEELRVLYVALTRAKEKLIIYSTINDLDKQLLNMYVMYKDEKIDYISSQKNNSYFQNILMALKDDTQKDRENKLFNINRIKVLDTAELEKLTKDINAKKDKNNAYTIEEKINELNSKIVDTEVSDKNSKFYKKVDEYYDQLVKKFDTSYKYTEDVNTKTRVSVSELKKIDYEDKEDINNLSNIFEKKQNEYIMEKPECLSSEKIHYTSARKGTLVHFILEHLDFKIDSKEKLSLYISNLVETSVITQEDKVQINVDSIYNFLNLKIGNELKIIDSNNIYREQEFILNDKAISNSTIQGVIDLYYINLDNTITLVDFKTDKLYKETEYINRYNKQLQIYKEALEKLKNVKVKNTYIYSFNLNKEIEVK